MWTLRFLRVRSGAKASRFETRFEPLFVVPAQAGT